MGSLVARAELAPAACELVIVTCWIVRSSEPGGSLCARTSGFSALVPLMPPRWLVEESFWPKACGKFSDRLMAMKVFGSLTLQKQRRLEL